MSTPQNSSNKYISFRLAYIYRDYFILNKLTLLMMTAAIWCCVINLFWSLSHVGYMHLAGYHW